MKRELRQVYRDLINLMPVGYGLCNFCRYGQFEGGSCCEAELECQHPLEAIAESTGGDHPFNTWTGGDCWGFRPSVNLQKLGEIASITATGNNAHLSTTYGGYIAIIPSRAEREEGLIGGIV